MLRLCHSKLITAPALTSICQRWIYGASRQQTQQCSVEASLVEITCGASESRRKLTNRRKALLGEKHRKGNKHGLSFPAIPSAFIPYRLHPSLYFFVFPLESNLTGPKPRRLQSEITSKKHLSGGMSWLRPL